MLKEIVARILPLLRSTDTFCRYGGEEFAVILGDTPVLQGLGVAEQICADVAKSPVALTKGGLLVTVSCGVATLADDPGDLDESADGVMARADEALYEAKREGRNRAKKYKE